MGIPIISRFTGSDDWPAEAWIIKTYADGVDVVKTRARRADEIEDDQVAPEETKFQLKGGGETEPIPYSSIHKTNQGPLVILKSPEKGTYTPYKFDDDGEDLELKAALKNQEWLRWGRDSLRDFSLTWQQDKDFWDKHAGKVVVILALVFFLVGSVLDYMMWGDLSEILSELAKQAS